MIYTTKGPIRAIKRQQYTYEEIKDTVYELIRMTLLQSFEFDCFRRNVVERRFNF